MFARALLVLAFTLCAGACLAATDTICLHQPTGVADPVDWTLKLDGTEETTAPVDNGSLTWDGVAGKKWCVTYTVPSFTTYYTVTWWANWAGGALPAVNQSFRVYESAECRADYNDNGAVDLTDVSYVNGRVGTGCPQGCRDDLTQNGAIDLGDVSATLALLGEDC